jgi:E3 ubiquitin-protein ligase RGLG
MDEAEILIVFAVLVGLVLLVFSLSKKGADGGARRARSGGKTPNDFAHIADRFTSLDEVQAALRDSGLESCNLVLGIDFTKSNEFTGRNTFGGKCLHALSTSILNPYQRVMSVLGRTLEVFDEDRMIPCFGFGDQTTKGKAVFPFLPDRPCYGFEEAMKRYAEVVPLITLSGPTNFAPVIRETIKIVQEERDFHVLVIIADGQVTAEADTVAAIVEASHYPISIVVVGVGDGPWDQMEEFDDDLPERDFDNFQFVDFAAVTAGKKNPDESFAMNALMEIPDQYRAIKQLKLLG